MYQPMTRTIIGLLAIILCVQTSKSQDAIFSQFYATPVYMNPAFAGADSGFRTALIYRNHPLQHAGNFSTMHAAIDVFVPELYGGIGLNVTSVYQGGLNWNNHIDFMYAYHLQLSSDWYMNLAAQAGYYRQDVNWSSLNFTNPSQAGPSQEFTHAPDFAAGMILYNDWIYGGFASHHLTEPAIGLFGDQRLPRKYTATFGMHIKPQAQRRANMTKYYISPNIIFQNQGDFTRFNYGLYFGVESFVAGLWYRHSLDNPSSLIVLAGLNLGDYRIGYSYDYSLSGYTDTFHGIHEISVSFSFLTRRQELRETFINCPGF